MAAQVVYSAVTNGSGLKGELFSEKVFWIAQRTPQRSHFVSLVESNGGTVTALEKNADYLICDHVRKDNPAGALSFKFIEESVRNGAIAATHQHICAPTRGTARELGAPTMARSSRVPFTTADDNLLYSWVRDAESQGRSVLGNVIYQDLEYTNNRHTWQSWRDRYVKNLRDKPPGDWESHILEVNSAMAAKSRRIEKENQVHFSAPLPSRVVAQSSSVAQSSLRTQQTSQLPISTPAARPLNSKFLNHTVATPIKREPTPEGVSFTPKNLFELLKNYDIIADTPYRKFVKSWDDFAVETEHTSEEWQDFFGITATKFHNAYMENNEQKKFILKRMKKWVAGNEKATLAEWMSYWRGTLKPKLPTTSGGTAESKIKNQEHHNNASSLKFALDGAAPSVLRKPKNRSPPELKKRTLEESAASPLDNHTKRRKIAGKTSEAKPVVERKVVIKKDEDLTEQPSAASSDQQDTEVLMDDVLQAPVHEVPPTQPITHVTASSTNPSTSTGRTNPHHDPGSQQLIAESSLRQEQSSADSMSVTRSISTPRKQRIDVLSQEDIASPQQGYSLLKAAATTSQIYDTQANFTVDTQDLEFDMPEPEGGFEEEPSDADEEIEGHDTVDNEAQDEWSMVQPEDGYFDDEVSFDPAFSRAAVDMPEVEDTVMPQVDVEVFDEEEVQIEVEMAGTENEMSTEDLSDDIEDVQPVAVVKPSSQPSSPPARSVPETVEDFEPDSGTTSDSDSVDEEDEQEVKTEFRPDSENGWEPELGTTSENISRPDFTASGRLRMPSEELGDDGHKVPITKPKQIDISSDESSSDMSSDSDEDDMSDADEDDEDLNDTTLDDQAAIREAYEERGIPLSLTRKPHVQATTQSSSSNTTQPSNPTQEKDISTIQNLGKLVKTLQQQGYSISVIRQALRAANGVAELTKRTCRSLQADGEIPVDVAGVWTPFNDKVFREKGVTRELLAKHGEEGCELRRLFLAEMGG